MTSKKVIIIGGVAGGASAAARLRRLDENATIILFERGGYISFANCGLPYYIGGTIKEKSTLTLQTPQSFHNRFQIDVRILSEVLAIDKDAKTVTVRNVETGETYTETYDQLILSMGAEPIKPSLKGMDSEKVFLLRSLTDTYQIKAYMDREQPKKAVVVGGGYIGVEMAENLHDAGLEVTVVEMQDQVIAPLDYDMACIVRRHMESKGIHLRLNNGLQSIQDRGNHLEVSLQEGSLTADILIMAIGVRPETILAKEAGLTVNERGGIVVDNRMYTSDPSILAVGDAVEVTDFVTGDPAMIPLAGPANKQGRIAADNLSGADVAYTGTQGSSILKVFDLTVATTGINEKTAKKKGYDYDTVVLWPSNHASYYPDGKQMCIKAVFEKTTGKILGAQIVGYEGVDKRCDVLATAIRFGATAFDLTKLELCYAPPYSSAKDPVNMVGYVIENTLTGKVRHFQWHDVASLPKDGTVTLLDVRTEGEYAHGHMDGFINIPVDTLRNRLTELAISKPVYVTCQVGLRGYVASRILSQKGFDVYNLTGGNLFYQTVMGK